MLSHIDKLDFSFHGPSPVIIAILLILSVFYSRWYYSRTVPEVKGFLRWFLITLRSFSIALILFCIAAPIAEAVITSVRKTRIAIIFDTSSSIKQPKDPSRSDDALRVLENLRSKLGNDAVFFGFDTGIRRLGSGSPEFTGNGTDISMALSTVLSMQYISSAVLISDGSSNIGSDPLKIEKLKEFPINTVCLGEKGAAGDFSISGVSVSPVGRDGESIPVEISANSPSGFSGNLPVEITEKNATAISGKINFHETGSSSVTLQIPLRGTGVHTYTVNIKTVDGDYEGNNSREFTINILKSSYKILVTADKPSPDFAFIRRVLDSVKSFDPYYIVGNETGKGTSNLFPSNLSGFDAAIFIDWGDNEKISNNVEKLKSGISGGMGVWFIGSSIPSDASKNLAGILPVTFTGADIPDSLFSVDLTETGQTHFITSGDGIRPTEWSSLPPLSSVTLINTIPDKGVTLAVAYPNSRKSNPMPILVTGKYGRGKTVVMPVSGIWRWKLMLEGAGMDEGFYNGFVTGLINWLITENEGSPLTVTTDYSSYLSGQEIKLEARLFDSVFSPVSGAEILIKTNALGLKIVMDEKNPYIYTGILGGLPPGEYSYLAAAFLDGKKYTETKGKINVEDYSVEMVDTEPDNILMEKIASTSGGMYITPSGIDSLMSVLTPKTVTERLERTWDLRMNPVFLALIILFLVVEWGIRKNKGMI